MFDNEDKMNDMDQNVNKDEDIFAEEDVVIPAQNTEEPEKKVDTTYRYSYIPNAPESDRNDSGAAQNAGSNENHKSDPVDTKMDKKHRKSMNAYVKAICCAILCGVIVGGCVLGAFAVGKNMTGNNGAAAVAATTTEIATNEDKLAENESGTVLTESTSDGTTYSVAEIADQCSSSVVAITNTAVEEVQTMFGVYQQESEGSGSGVIIAQTDDELLIVTNNHVVADSQELTVCFNDSEDSVYSAQIKGTDSDNDLAVIAINLSDISQEDLNSISIATVGDSGSLSVGDEVVAIGNALGLGQSVTSGVVSALEREVTIDSTTATLLQTDAAINPGNSGGALFNMKGELIGINSAKYASEQVEGMGFAIPISTAEPIIEELMTRETRTKLTENYGYLNISGADVSEEVSERYGIPTGVYIDSATEGGAAANAGIQKGDIITSLDGNSVDSISELKELLQYYPAGDQVEVVLQRNAGSGYEEMTVTVTLDNASEQSSNSTTSSQSGMQSYGSQGDQSEESQSGQSQSGQSQEEETFNPFN